MSRRVAGSRCASCSTPLPHGWPGVQCRECGAHSGAQPIAWSLTLCAAASMSTVVIAALFGVTTVGLHSVGMPLLLASSGTIVLFALLTSVWSASRVAALPLWLTLRSVLLTMVGTAVPGVGLFFGPIVAWLYLVDREPSAPGDEPRPDQRTHNPRGTGRPLAVLHLFAAVYFQAVISVVMNMSWWEVVESWSD